MESLKKSRKVVRTTFTKNAKELDKLISDKAELQNIKVSWVLLTEKLEKLRGLDEEIFSLSLEQTSDDDLVKEMETAEGYRKTFLELNTKYEDLLRGTHSSLSGSNDQEDNVSLARSSGVDRGRRKFKLPHIQFKTFDGNIKDWLPFWSQFNKVHEDPNIDLNDKVEYLIQATVPGSRARQLIESFPGTGENYQKMVDCLVSRFGREDLQIEVYVRELLKLIIHNAVSGHDIALDRLYDGIETQLRALETLGLTSSGYSAMLFPLIESCLPEELLRVWQRSLLAVEVKNAQDTNEQPVLEKKLESLMKFLQNEVENEQRVSLASEGFGLRASYTDQGRNILSNRRRHVDLRERVAPTATDLVNQNKGTEVRSGAIVCLFCGGNHASTNCFKAQNWGLEKRKQIVMDKKACLRCLKIGHVSRKCRTRLRCVICTGSHIPLMCPDSRTKKQHVKEVTKSLDGITGNQSLSQNSVEILACTNGSNSHVFLQTLRVWVKGVNGNRNVRVLIDTGSQNTYIVKSTAEQLGYVSKRKNKIVHSLFGGTTTELGHDCYEIEISFAGYSCSLEALSQPVICGYVSPVFNGTWVEELRNLQIELADSADYGSSPGPIEILIGSDIAGKLFTGRRHVLDCGLVAMETVLGWTLMGRIPLTTFNSLSMMTTSLLLNDVSLAQLWELDTLGIKEPSDHQSRNQLAAASRDFFLNTVDVAADGRYIVRLPWIEGHLPLPTNLSVAKKRLCSVLKKLESNGLFGSYAQIFDDWENEGIIEKVPFEAKNQNLHYLPHRPVLKENSTTRIRPVFDASARERDRPSLNHCLEKGINLIELIPTLLTRFRLNKIGVMADIRKAFLQINIHEDDRDFLRFLWVGPDGEERVYRHKRVVFGINSSPFLLGATIDHHLTQTMEKVKQGTVHYSMDTLKILVTAFYVDNCVTSLPDEESLQKFRQEATLVMADAKFDLRGWEYSGQICETDDSPRATPLLGLVWDTKNDMLIINNEWLKNLDKYLTPPITKRIMLSLAQKVFDPIGFTSPTTLIPKLLLQQTWEMKLPWDAEVSSEISEAFCRWVKDLSHLLEIKLPRWVHSGSEDSNASLHTFCDASKKAYSTVVFLRCIHEGQTMVHLLAAKSRVAPIRPTTIPRLELLAAVIGARLCDSVKKSMQLEIKIFFWTDSSTLLSWISGNEQWASFVHNRVSEIRCLTSVEDWRHIPGEMNPADLPSRGCSPRQLIASKWWEGPSWLYGCPESWPHENIAYNQEEVNKEKRKGLVTSLTNASENKMSSDDWHLTYFSKYFKTIRMVAWIFRFTNNTRFPQNRLNGELSMEEIDKAEKHVFRTIQQESFSSIEDKRLKSLNPYIDEAGVFRLKTRICARKDSEQFCLPVVLPGKHPLVTCLIFDTHVKSMHVRTQSLMAILRERHWILGGRRVIKSAISRCVTCKRHNGKPFVRDSPPLPLDRVRDAAAFEVTGVDFTGPLYLKNGEKTWVCLFTCAIYRGVHLELCTSLSVCSFLQALRRFIARRGRPKVIYSDNGTNFVGADNAFEKLDWEQIALNSGVERIIWRFSPPTAPWWGGFWERLVGSLKQLLRKSLGHASLSYEELITVLCDCESVLNSRPLTYLSSDAVELMPITPMMFLREQQNDVVSDFEAVDRKSLCRRVLYQVRLRTELRERFRSEYLGQLKYSQSRKGDRLIRLGEIVLIGNDNDKRLNWPLGKVIELIPGKDGHTRLVKLSTVRGQLLRPIQRLYPLECADEEYPRSPPADDFPMEPPDELQDQRQKDLESDSAPIKVESDSACSEGVSPTSRVPDSWLREKITRSGRVSKVPQRFL